MHWHFYLWGIFQQVWHPCVITPRMVQMSYYHTSTEPMLREAIAVLNQVMVKLVFGLRGLFHFTHQLCGTSMRLLSLVSHAPTTSARAGTIASRTLLDTAIKPFGYWLKPFRRGTASFASKSVKTWFGIHLQSASDESRKIYRHAYSPCSRIANQDLRQLHSFFVVLATISDGKILYEHWIRIETFFISI